MKTFPSYLWPIAVLIGSILLLQIHAIEFWTDQVGPSGWAWSILLEMVALWLWYQKAITKRAFALLASILTLLGPLYSVAEPLLYDVVSAEYSDDAKQSRIASLNAEQARLEASIATFRANSEERTGWLRPIEKAENRLIEIGQTLASLKQTVDSSKTTWQKQVVIVMQLAALVLFQITSVFAITTLSNRNDTSTPKSEEKELNTESSPLPEELPVLANSSNVTTLSPNLSRGEFSYTEIVELRSELLENLELQDKTQAQFAEFADVSPRDIVFLKQHERLVREGKRTISAQSLGKIRIALKKC